MNVIQEFAPKLYDNFGPVSIETSYYMQHNTEIQL